VKVLLLLNSRISSPKKVQLLGLKICKYTTL